MSNENDVSFSSSKAIGDLPILPWDTQEFLHMSLKCGLSNGRLDLTCKKIEDGMVPELCEWLKKFDDKLKDIVLSNNLITSNGACLALSNHRELDDKFIKSLGEYVKINKCIKMISIGKTKVSDAGIEILAPYLDGNTSLKHLYLWENKEITDKSMPLLEKIVEKSCIQYLDVSRTSIHQKNTLAAPLAWNAFRDGSNKLDFASEDIDDEDIAKICEGMKRFGIDKLEQIINYGCNITSKGASLLANTIKESDSILSYLGLSGNKIDDDCAISFGELLQDNKYLEVLLLDNNRITDNGIEIVSEYLFGNTTLKDLVLENNIGITDSSVPLFIEVARKSHILNINLYDTGISTDKMHEIDKVLSIPIEERDIPIKSSTKSAAKIS